MRHRPLLAVLAALALLAPAAPARAAAPHQLAGVPAYWAPDAHPEEFVRLAQNVPAVELVVVNGSASRAESPFDPAWASAVSTLHDAGINVLAYVDTGYLGTTGHLTRTGSTAAADWIAQAKADIDEWYQLYGPAGLDGVFLDQTVASCDQADAYAELSDHLSAGHPRDMVVINPGVGVGQCYEPIADVIVSFENTWAAYQAHVPLAWETAHPDPRKFWHLVHDAPDAAAMAAAVARSKANNAGYVYVTDDTLHAGGFPWDSFPAYWHAELAALAGVADTVPPDPPHGFTASVQPGVVELSWRNPYDNVAVADYEVVNGSVSLGTCYPNRFRVTGLAAGTTYRFKVRARDVSGNIGQYRAITVTTPS
ncbi:spherulation-specific family 4 protein [Nonomuraea sp. NPDC050310]|uniref:spherulation-specific family 4 protein n=1 Tax=Nonomuraea sp. NPDC050310 TaxID=3154935 RepID=UPI0033C8FC49